MKSFALSEENDVLILNSEIQLVDSDELVRQTVQSVLNTNKGEWFLNPDEGINFRNILGKRTSMAESGRESQKFRIEYDKISEEKRRLNERLAKRLDGVL